MKCPKCGSENVLVQRESTGKVGASTNTVVIKEAKKSRGCLYWMFWGWWYQPMHWLLYGWWKNLLFGGKKRGGFNFHADKNLNRTVAVCQNCGHTWKV